MTTEPHFIYQETDSEGNPVGEPKAVFTVTGLILNSHPRASVSQIRHLAAIARETPGYPVDLSAWQGDYPLWFARIEWRGPPETTSAERFI